MTSLLVTLTGHVTSGSHIDYAQWYILYYYYRKKKNAGKSRACAEHTSMTSLPIRAASGHFRSCAMVRSPIPRNMAWTCHLKKITIINQSINQSINKMKITLNPIKTYDSQAPLINILCHSTHYHFHQYICFYIVSFLWFISIANNVLRSLRKITICYRRIKLGLYLSLFIQKSQYKTNMQAILFLIAKYVAEVV
jgi:hypothetical protein